MAQLQDIVAAVLQDVLSAQHQANLMAESLVGEYANSPVLKSFPVPAISVGEMEITLNFAFVGGEELHDGQHSADIQSMKVIVDSARLASMGRECLQSITLKISSKEIAAANHKINNV